MWQGGDVRGLATSSELIISHIHEMHVHGYQKTKETWSTARDMEENSGKKPRDWAGDRGAWNQILQS